MTPDVHAVVVAGGRGIRLWPQSTRKRPKQYLDLASERPLLAETLLRVAPLVPEGRRLVATVGDQLPLARECARGLVAPDGFVVEPEGRNTGPAILLALAVLEARGAGRDDLAVFLPSDHLVRDGEGFCRTLRSVRDGAPRDGIVVIGAVPDSPRTGYGYIKKGGEAAPGFFRADRFTEKPDGETAARYLAHGGHLWNVGVFAAPVGTFLAEFEAHAPDLFASYGDFQDHCLDPPSLAAVYRKTPAISMDYAVMEKSPRVLVVPADFDWTDLGSWDALEGVGEGVAGNTVVKSAGARFWDASGNVVFAPGRRVFLSGVDDLVLVSSGDVLMVAPKAEASGRVAKIVGSLAKEGGSEAADLL